MRRLLILVAAAVLALPASADTPPVMPGTCRVLAKDAASCDASKQELKRARAEFQRGLKQQQAGRFDDAFRAFEEASRLVPKDVEIMAAREVARQQVVFDHLQRGNRLLESGSKLEALAQFRQALELDSSNEFALQRMRDALGPLPSSGGRAVRVISASSPVQLAPKPGRRDFHYRGDGRGLLQAISREFGIKATIDDSVVARALRFDVEQADFETAMNLATKVTKSFWIPLFPDQVLIAADNPQMRQQYERMALRTFWVPDVASAQEMNDVVNILRTIFEIRFVTQSLPSNTLTVRAPQRTLEAATRFMETLGLARPQVALEVKFYEVNQAALRNLGISLPLQFQMFNISSEALGLLKNTNVQDLVNQLIASGGINQANNTALSALLAQLQNQQSSLFSQPFATFGGGITLFGVGIPAASAKLTENRSRVTTLENMTVRAAQGNAATIRLGSRYPILNAIFSPIFNTPALAQVIRNQNFQAPFPSFNYEDLGVTLKATPQVNGMESVSLQVELAVRTLGGQALNGIPVISTREYKGTITVKQGEPAVVVGYITDTEQKSLSGLPVIGRIPGLGDRSNQSNHTELLVVITPHIIRAGEENQPAIPMP